MLCIDGASGRKELSDMENEKILLALSFPEAQKWESGGS